MNLEVRLRNRAIPEFYECGIGTNSVERSTYSSVMTLVCHCVQLQPKEKTTGLLNNVSKFRIFIPLLELLARLLHEK